MIKWSMHQTDDVVTIDIKGHAGYSKRGQDIVCSAVSTLVYFFINCVKKIEEDSIKHVKLKDGDVTLKLVVVVEIKPLLEVFQHSLRDIESQYPSCLKELNQDD